MTTAALPFSVSVFVASFKNAAKGGERNEEEMDKAVMRAENEDIAANPSTHRRVL